MNEKTLNDKKIDYAFLIQSTFIRRTRLKTKKIYQLISNLNNSACCLNIRQFFSQNERTNRLDPPLPVYFSSLFNPIPPGGAQSARATFNFLSSWQFLVFFLDFLGEFLKFILVLDFNWKNSKSLKNFWAWSISQTGPKNEKNFFF